MPISASDVAPPARIDWPAMEEGKKSCSRPMNHARVGIVPLHAAKVQVGLEKAHHRKQGIA